MLISIIPSNAFATNTNKKVHMAGRPISTPANTIHNGKTAPTNAIGNDGDFYIDTLALDFYGPKLQGHWPAPVSLRGPAGSNGTDGKNGSNEKGTSQTGLTGPQGPAGPVGPIGKQGIPGAAGAQGPIGLTGPAGENGSIGLTGPAGQTGTPGATGPAGAAGSSGPQGSPGQQGPQGPSGNVGATGPQGATGSQGPQGSVGATGPSQVQVLNLTPWVLSTSTAGTSNTSSAFGSLLPMKSYQFMISVSGRLTSLQAPSYGIRVGLTLSSSDSSAILNYAVSSSFGYSNDGDANSYSKESFIVIGTISTSNSNPSSTLSLTATDSGPTTGVDPMTLTGSTFIQLVGALN